MIYCVGNPIPCVYPFCVVDVPSVQHECIPQAILGMDVICQAKSGMGKTAVFVLATLHQLSPVDGEVHVVVICHARELAYQIQKEFERFCKYLPDVKSHVCFGGAYKTIFSFHLLSHLIPMFDLPHVA